MSEFNYVSAAVAVTVHERKAARLEITYDALVQYLDLTSDTESADLTTAARRIVVTGAGADGTATGAAITEDDLTGRNPGAGPVLSYWKAARTVRVGLVRAIARAAGDDDTDDDDTEQAVNLLTRAGLKADLEDVIRAWKTAHESN